MLLIIDRIIEAPSKWQMCLTPLITWLNIHKEDQLVGYLFAAHKDLPIELSRLHSLVSAYCSEY